MGNDFVSHLQPLFLYKYVSFRLPCGGANEGSTRRTIEIDIWDKIKYEGNLNLLEKQLIGYFGKLRFAQFLHNPNYIEYQQGKFVKRDEKKRLPERKIEDKMKFGYANIEQVKAVEYCKSSA